MRALDRAFTVIYWAAAVFNFATALGYYYLEGDPGQAAWNLGWAIIFVLMGAFGSFVMWNR